MTRCAAVLFGGLLCFTLAAFADEGKSNAAKPLGHWTRALGDNSVAFVIKDDSLRATVNTDGNIIEVEADYAMSRDGVLFGRLAKVNKKGTEEGPSEGDLFSFQSPASMPN
jgi:hypothetical protein